MHTTLDKHIHANKKEKPVGLAKVRATGHRTVCDTEQREARREWREDRVTTKIQRKKFVTQQTTAYSLLEPHRRPPSIVALEANPTCSPVAAIQGSCFSSMCLVFCLRASSAPAAPAPPPGAGGPSCAQAEAVRQNSQVHKKRLQIFL